MNGRRVAIAGAGAIGCTLAARLAASGVEVSVFARGKTLAALRERGVELSDTSGTVRVPVRAADDAATLGPQDVVFLCSKSHDLLALATAADALIGPETLVVPLVNGVPFWYFHREGGRFDGAAVEAVDPGGALMRRLPLDRVLGAVTFITAETPAPGVARSTTPHLLMLGEPAGGMSPPGRPKGSYRSAQHEGNPMSPPGRPKGSHRSAQHEGAPMSGRLTALCRLLTAAGIESRPMDRIRDPLWSKLIGNLTSNPLSVTTRATLEEIYTRPDLLGIVRHVMFEARLVAGCYGIRLPYDPIEFIALAAGMGAVRTSMLQDHERGRPLELASIGDAVVELAGRYDVPVPHIRRLLADTRAAALEDTT